MKHLFATLTLLWFLLNTNAQTSISGGIYTNTTWTKVNSPYFVTDTVVVFPNVTLTIEPGVVVKFNANKRLELRQSNLIAVGNSTDSIFFTSTSGLTPGTWSGLFFNHGSFSDTALFSFCKFTYADVAILSSSNQYLKITNSIFSNNNIGLNAFNNTGSSPYTVDSSVFENNLQAGINGESSFEHPLITNSFFINNHIGISGVGGNGIHRSGIIDNSRFVSNQLALSIAGFVVSNCEITNNQTGIDGGENNIESCHVSNNSVVGLLQAGDTVRDCVIDFNGIGFQDWEGHDFNVITNNRIENNTIGIKIELSASNRISIVSCNKICNNLTYNLYYNANFGGNASFANNYWCFNDSSQIANTIYDGYDNINLGLTDFRPFDTLPCSTSHCSAYFTLNADTIPHNYTAINMSSGSGQIQCIWNWGDGTTDTALYPSHIYGTPGVYSICLTVNDSLGCTSSYCNDFSLFRTTNSLVTVNVFPPYATGISPNGPAPQNFRVTPNPAADYVNISFDGAEGNALLVISNLIGQKQIEGRIRSGNTQISTESLPNGVYFITVLNGKTPATQRLLIHR